MKPTTLRACASFSLICSLLAILSEVYFKSAIPTGLRGAYDACAESLPMGRLTLGVVAGLVSSALALVSTIGLLMLKPWAPKLGVTATLLGVIAGLQLGVNVQNALTTTLSYLATVFWGAALALGHTPAYTTLTVAE